MRQVTSCDPAGARYPGLDIRLRDTQRPLDSTAHHGHKLTPGIYVGTQADEDDDEPFEEKMPRLVEELRGLFAESDRLQGRILENLEGLTNGS